MLEKYYGKEHSHTQSCANLLIRPNSLPGHCIGLWVWSSHMSGSRGIPSVVVLVEILTYLNLRLQVTCGGQVCIPESSGSGMDCNGVVGSSVPRQGLPMSLRSNRA